MSLATFFWGVAWIKRPPFRLIPRWILKYTPISCSAGPLCGWLRKTVNSNNIRCPMVSLGTWKISYLGPLWCRLGEAIRGGTSRFTLTSFVKRGAWFTLGEKHATSLSHDDCYSTSSSVWKKLFLSKSGVIFEGFSDWIKRLCRVSLFFSFVQRKRFWFGFLQLHLN